jgi:transaldolase
MKLFLDIGDVEAIQRAQDTGLLDGVTTNPSHLAKVGKPVNSILETICRICPGPISAEVMAEDAPGMIAEARDLAGIASNIAIKLPLTVEGLKAVPVLEKEGIKCNVTMIFSATQAFLAMKAGASFISIVLSRLDAIANESEILVADAALTRDNFGFASEIIAGSMKTQNHVLYCLRAGIDIATVPPDLFFQMYKHNLTDAGLAQFKTDWAAFQGKL